MPELTPKALDAAVGEALGIEPIGWRWLRGGDDDGWAWFVNNENTLVECRRFAAAEVERKGGGSRPIYPPFSTDPAACAVVKAAVLGTGDGYTIEAAADGEFCCYIGNKGAAVTTEERAVCLAVLAWKGKG